MVEAEATTSNATLVSVVIPTIGRDELRRAVESALDQTVSVEVIVVVDRLDRFGQVVNDLGNLEVKVIQNPRKGAPAARNVGAEQATGDFIAFLDDDDHWLPQKLELQLSQIGDKKDNFISVCGTYFTRADGGLDKDVRREFRGNPSSLGMYLLKRKWPWIGNALFCTSTLLLDKKTFMATPWDEDLPCCQDVDLFIRLSQTPGLQIFQHRKPLVNLQQGSTESITWTRAPEDNLVFANKHRNKFNEKVWSDFLATHLVMPYIRSHDISRAIHSIRTEMKAIPHLGAIIRALSAWWLR
jgi:hypothetical protein